MQLGAGSARTSSDRSGGGNAWVGTGGWNRVGGEGKGPERPWEDTAQSAIPRTSPPTRGILVACTGGDKTSGSQFSFSNSDGYRAAADKDSRQPRRPLRCPSRAGGRPALGSPRLRRAPRRRHWPPRVGRLVRPEFAPVAPPYERCGSPRSRSCPEFGSSRAEVPLHRLRWPDRGCR